MPSPQPLHGFRATLRVYLRTAAAVLFGLGLLASGAVRAAEPARDQPARDQPGIGQPGIDLQRAIAFAIPAQPLADALDMFSRTSNVQVLYDSRLAAGQHSMAVQGVWPIGQALQLLLQGTGLLVYYTRHHDVILTTHNGDTTSLAATPPPPGAAMLSLRTLYVHPPAAELGSPTTNSVSYRLYGGVMQSRIQAALRGDKSTSRGSYSVKLAIWVGSTGILLRHILLQSTGDVDLDRGIERVLRGLNFGQPPPANLPQPVNVGIQVRTP